MVTLLNSVSTYNKVSVSIAKVDTSPIMKSLEAIEKSISRTIPAESVEEQTKEQGRFTKAVARSKALLNMQAAAIKSCYTSLQSVNSAAAGFASDFFTIDNVKAVLSASDSLTTMESKLNSVNDGSQTTEDLQNKIYEAAQRSRGSYTGMADTVANLQAQTGDLFGSNDEAIQFTENMQKGFASAGMDTSGVESAMGEMQTAMAGGTLGSDYLAGLSSSAPGIYDALNAYTQEYQNSSGKTLSEMADEGIISSGVMKNALLSYTDEINSQFASTPATFSQVWTSFQNMALHAFAPVLEKLSEIVNSDQFQAFLTGVGTALSFLSGIVLNVIDAFGLVVQFIQQNSALIIGTIAVLAAIAVGAALLTAAAWFLANLPIILLISLVIAAVAGFLAAGGTITQVITGVAHVFAGIYATVYNLFVSLYNFFASFAEFFANVFNDPVTAAKNIFFDFLSEVVDAIGKVASALDAIFGTNFQSTVDGMKTKLLELRADYVEDNKIQIERMEEIDGSELGDSWAASALDIMDGLSNGAGDLLGGALQAGDTTDFESLLGGDGNTAAIADSVSNIEGNTSDIADSVELSSEDLETLRELAEMESIQNFVSLTPTVQVTTGDLNSTVDVNDIVTKIQNALTVEIAASSSQILGVA